MEDLVTITVAANPCIYLRAEFLCTRSQYFQTALKGGFSEAKDKVMEIPWEGDSALCELFLFWLSQAHFPQEFPFKNAFQLLNCCAYFQVAEELWEIVQLHVTLPLKYSEMSAESADLWVRQVVPFPIASKITSRMENKLERLMYMLAWLNEKTATSASEKRVLTHCEDFYALQDWVVGTFTPSQASHVQLIYGQPQSTVYSVTTRPSTTPATGSGQTGQMSVYGEMLRKLQAFPIAANCLETVWLLQMCESGVLANLVFR